MPDEVRTTTRPPPPTRPEATADTGRSALVVVNPSVVSGLMVADRQRVAAASGLPVSALARLAESGVPVVIDGSPSPRAAEALAASRSTALGVPTRVLAGPGPGALLTSVGALLAAAASLLLVPFVGAGAWFAASSVGWALLPALLAVGLTTVGVRGLLAGLRESQGPGLARREHDAEVARLRAAPEAWAALFALRDASLAPDVPVTVQADLWTSLEAAEAALERGEDVAGWTAALTEARVALREPDRALSADARARLGQVASRARAALTEAGRA